jgi:hypothetical protein
MAAPVSAFASQQAATHHVACRLKHAQPALASAVAVKRPAAPRPAINLGGGGAGLRDWAHVAADLMP